MKKFLHRTMALLAAMLLLASCAEGGQDKVIAKVNDVEIHNSEFQIWMKTSMNNATIEIPANYDDLSEDEKTQVEEMREQVLEYLIDERVQLEKAKEEGIDQLSEAELAEVDGYVISQMNSWYDSIAYEVSQEGELGGVEAAEETIKRYNSYIDYSGLNKEYLTEWFGRQIIISKLQEKYYAQLEPDEAQLRAKYDERVASDKERYTEDPDVYADDIAYSTPLYNPGGYRRVSHILIALTDEQQEEINNLQTEGNAAEAETKQAEYLEQAKQKADEVYTELTENGKDFEDAMKEYSSDIDYYGELNQPEGYVFNAANRSNLAPEFVSGGMALAKVGDISNPVKTDFGYHILRFEEDIKEATTAFEDMPSELIAEFKSAIQNDAYESLKAEWRASMTVEQYLDKVVYPTPTPGPTPSPTAAPTPSAVVTATPVPTETTPPVEGSTFIPSATEPSPSAGEETPTGTPDEATPTPTQ